MRLTAISKFSVGQDLVRAALTHDLMVLGEDQAAVGEHVEGVSRSWVASTIVLPARLRSTTSSMSHCCRPWVERGGGFVEEQNLGVHDQDRGDGDALLLAAGELVGRPVGQVR